MLLAAFLYLYQVPTSGTLTTGNFDQTEFEGTVKNAVATSIRHIYHLPTSGTLTAGNSDQNEFEGTVTNNVTTNIPLSAINVLRSHS